MTPDADTDEITAPEESAEWLDLITNAEAYFSTYQTTCDNIDRTYSNLDSLRSLATGDTEFHLFWSNIQVMGPAIYARPPQPVVTPKFKDRRPVYRIASEVLERVLTVTFDHADINSTMLEGRDDLTINARGVAWVRYDDGKVCIEHLDRKDFLHDPGARKWSEVAWVARRGWLSYSEMKDRFGQEKADEVSYSVRDRENSFGPQNKTRKCGVWEIWHRGENRVVWVTEGVTDVLDSDKPHLSLEGFFPCPKPAYATTQRRGLIPIPDVIYYQGQLNQISNLTARIHALGEALKMKGFYQGGGEIGDAVEAAMKAEDDGRVLVPVSSIAAFGSGGEPVVWLPIDMVATTLTALVELRRQLIEDVYQIIGLSDIMRGATQAEETLGAQQLKQQNGSARVRDKQNELVRLARDLVRIAAEIIAEKYSRDDLVEMAQMDIPTRADVKKQVKDLEGQAQGILKQVEDAKADPQVQRAMQENPEAVQQAMAKAQEQLQGLDQQIGEAKQAPTLEDVLDFLKDEKLRPFVLDIETDSTVYPDEMQEKASRAEFLQVFTGAMAGVTQLAQLGPQALGLAGGVLKFTLAPYRVGREIEGLIDDFVDSAPQIVENMAAQGQDPMAEANSKLAEAEMKKAEAAVAKVQADTQGKMQEMQLRAAEAQAKTGADQQRFTLEIEQTKGNLAETKARVDKIFAEIDKIGIDARNQTVTQERENVKAAAAIQAKKTDQQMAARGQATDAAFRAKGEGRAERQQQFTEQDTDRQRALAEQTAQAKPKEK
ncbi:MAG: hypothetical protein ACRCXM_17220 [Beijerinckiaceae bacterium]